MMKIIYIVILSYFALGGIGFYLINRNKPKETARNSYTKFGTYFVIINILFFSIVFNPAVFQVLSLIIISVGLYELVSLKIKVKDEGNFFYLSMIIFLMTSLGFYLFSGLDKQLILFSFLILSIFDSFSQISGQLWGVKKILPYISPNKTFRGSLGGAGFALASAFLLRSLIDFQVGELMFLTVGIIVSAFLGDLAASLYKRHYNVKDYSRLLPGHGGFLDRFDSLIAGGAWVTVCIQLININGI